MKCTIYLKSSEPRIVDRNQYNIHILYFTANSAMIARCLLVEATFPWTWYNAKTELFAMNADGRVFQQLEYLYPNIVS